MNEICPHTLAASQAQGRRLVTVTVSLSGNPPEFDMTSADIDVDKIKTGSSEDYVLRFNNYKNGNYSNGFEVNFELEVDEDNEDYGFFLGTGAQADPYQAISVKKIASTGICPPAGKKWGGFKPTAATRTSLTVENRNDHLQYFAFTLFFSRAGEIQPSLAFDPIGDDQNGHA